MLDDEFDTPNVMTAERFSLEVERRRQELNDPDITYLEIAAEYLEELGIGAENGRDLIAPPLFDKIRSESMARNLLKDKSTAEALV